MFCPACGSENISIATKCWKCCEVLTNEPVVIQPQSNPVELDLPVITPPPSPDVPSVKWIQYAGFWKRYWAFTIDTIALSIVCMILLYLLDAVGAVKAVLRIKLFFDSDSLWTVVGWVYFCGFESSRWQATPGKIALGIRVIDYEGKQISLFRATVRHFSKVTSGLILFIGFFMAGFTKYKQALHDIFAKCLVVKDV